MPRKNLPPEKKKSAYHHGDLKEAVRKTALKLIVKRGDVTFSLREIANLINVSHPALYRHFASKQAVLALVAEEGFKILAQELTLARTRAGSNVLVMLQEQALAYVDFARRCPGHFHCMFHVELRQKDEWPEVFAASEANGAILMETVRLGKQAGILDTEASDYTIFLHLWSCLHGFSELLLNQQFPIARQDDSKLREQLLKDVIELLLRRISQNKI